MKPLNVSVEADLDKIKKEVEIEKMGAEIAKLFAETVKINRENRCLPFVWATGFMAVSLGVAKLFLQ